MARPVGRGRGVRLLRFALAAAASGAAVFGTAAARADDRAIVVPETTVRSAPFDVAPAIARLHRGDQVRGDDQLESGWRRVELPDGRHGFVLDADTQHAEPPPAPPGAAAAASPAGATASPSPAPPPPESAVLVQRPAAAGRTPDRSCWAFRSSCCRSERSARRRRRAATRPPTACSPWPSRRSSTPL